MLHRWRLSRRRRRKSWGEAVARDRPKACRQGPGNSGGKTMTTKFSLATVSAVACMLLGGAGLAQEAATVAFLMPDQASTRYEEHDFPGFKAAMEELCPDCTVIYQNANADATLQQQ